MSQNPIIKKGYKQTEIGVIPEDWEVKKIDEVFYVTAGGDMDVATYSGIKNEYYQYPIYSNALPNKGLYGFSSIFKENEGTITITARGQIGVANARDHKYVAIGRILVLNPINQDIDIRYISEYVNKFIRFTSESTGVPQLTAPQVSKYFVVIPPNIEQSAIAAILSDTDALIENLDKLIEKKKAIKQGTMQELLTGKRRLPGFNGEWEDGIVGDLFTLSASYSKTEFIEKDGIYLIMDMGSVSQEGKNIACKRTNLESDLLNIGDLVMPKDDIGGGNIIGRTVCIEKSGAYVLSDHVYKLSPKNKNIDPQFFSFIINSGPVNSDLRKKVAGSAQLGLGRRSVESQALRFPKDKVEQERISKIISDQDDEITNLYNKKIKYTLLKQGMMQQLLTGNIRVYGNQ